ncbi:MAG: hydrogenase nickel incorporation protein HypB [SAR324 cluster bacterium]|nr:hydrogenase nickel incorporation protein HypB [SAR324 cluster bacterium]
MCQECGCLEVDQIKIDGKLLSARNHTHQHDHSHHAENNVDTGREISIKQNILQKNNQIASHNREHFAAHHVFSMNWISAPGSGKTTLLEKMIEDLGNNLSIAVIEGDQQTDNDAARIRQAGAEAVQVNTGAACHLDAEMIHQALHKLPLQKNSLLVIENVGNMVCPTAYDLGEHLKLSIISCTEGDDKPLKYPDLLLTSKVLLINKIDLLPYLDFNVENCMQWAKKINPEIIIFPVSAKTKEGLSEFYQWLQQNL